MSIKYIKNVLIFLLLILLLFSNVIDANVSETKSIKKALVLNTDEHSYGSLHCKIIINQLNKNGYNVTYLENEEVTLNYIKNNLSADIVYLNTHAGYWDTTNDGIPDKIVIATGEKWTENTKTKYSFECENNLIVKGEVGDDDFIAFTPEFIDFFYDSDDFSNSLIYMATCHASYDSSMAESFLSSGASVYVGWNKYTVFWTNSITSIIFFNLLDKDLSVNQVCRLIGSGSFYNFLLGSKLVYFGDGCYKFF